MIVQSTGYQEADARARGPECGGTGGLALSQMTRTLETGEAELRWAAWGLNKNEARDFKKTAWGPYKGRTREFRWTAPWSQQQDS